MLARIAWATNMAASAYDVFEDALEWLCEHTGYPIGHAFMVIGSEGEEAIPTSIWHGADGEEMACFCKATEGMVVHGEGILGQVMLTRMPVQIRDVTRDDAFLRKDEARIAGLRSAFAIPILVGEKPWAALEFYMREERTLDEEMLQLVDACGVMLGRAVERDLMAIEVDKRKAQLEQAEKITNFGTWEWMLATNEVAWSPRLYEIYGVSPADFDGTFEGHLLRMGSRDRERMRAKLHEALATSTPFHFEEEVVSGGKRKELLYRGEVVLDPAGNPVRLVGVCQDITLFKEARERELALAREQAARHAAEAKAAELARLTRELERSNRELDQFAYVASHDLKAPLRGIANLAGWLEEDLGERLGPESRKHIELLKGRVHRMEALIDGLLTYSRVGRKKIPPESVDVRKLIDEVIDLLAPGDEVSISIADDMPVFVTPRILLEQVFHNLISNALKHARAETPRLEVGVRDAGEPSGFWEFWVKDNGPGIHPRYQDRIWEIFQTLQPRDKVEGTGIGLALVKKIVEQQGGSVGVVSRPGEGAKFYFFWPKESR